MIRYDLPESATECSVIDCGRPIYGHGFCSAHYQRWRKHGDPRPDVPIRRVDASLSERFWAKVNKGPGCWEWLGSKHPSGHGTIRVGAGPKYAHRVSLEMAGQAIPQGCEVDHICMNPSCVRPDHLRVATRKQNEENKPMRRASASGLRGVSYFRETRRWRAHVTHHGKFHHLGFFATKEEAGEAARLARIHLFTHNNDDYQKVDT